MYDVLIIGGGPAGLSAALLLGRCRRRVLLIDSNQPRNAVSKAVNGFLTRDGIAPLELRRIGREQLKPYSSVEFLQAEVMDAHRFEGGFEAVLNDGRTFSGRMLLLATGVSDVLPPIEGFREFYGRGVYHCPHCDGWEVCDQPLAVYGKGEFAFRYAFELKSWSDDVALFSDGDPDLPPERVQHLARYNIKLYTEAMARLEGDDTGLRRICFGNGEGVDRRALFFSPDQYQRSPIAIRLGCEAQEGMIKVGDFQVTNVPGLFVAGDAAWRVQAAIVAAAEGAKAAMEILNRLLAADFGY